jgi:hypothetical protein
MMNEEPLAWEIEVVICSPMRRTVQTMVEGLACVLSGEGGLMGEARREVKVEFNADWQGKSRSLLMWSRVQDHRVVHFKGALFLSTYC